MAIEYDISGLLGKTENEGSTDAGRLTAKEFNTLVQAVGEVQTKVEGTIKGIKYNGGAEEGGQTFTTIDDKGFLMMTVADSSGYNLTSYITKPPTFIARGSACPIGVYVSSKKVVGDGNEPASAACVVNIYLNDVLVHTGQVYDQEYGNAENTQWYDPTKSTLLTFDLSTAKATSLVVGDPNEIRVEVNNRFGKVTTEYCEVNVIELAMVVNSFGVTNVFTEKQKPNLLVTVNGSDANVSATVDGIEILKDGVAYNGAMTNFGEQIFTNVNTHGVHTITTWASVTRTSGGQDFVISTEPISYTYIYGTSSAKPVVMSVISNTTPEEYSTLNVSYIAYKYNDTATAVSDTVYVSLCEHLGYDNEGKLVVGRELTEPIGNGITFDVATNSGTGTAGISLFPITDGDKTVSLVGKRVVKLSIGDYVQYSEIEVLASSVKLNQLTGYAVYLSSSGRNNKQADKREWISKDGKDKSGNKYVVDVTFDDNVEFLDTGSGWLPDEDGNVAMHLRKGRYFTLNYAPFVDNPTYDDKTNNGTGRGKTISFEIATRNCLKNNSPVITCLDSSNGSERGFVITASSATIKSNNFGLSANFRENTRIKIDFVIEGIQTEYTFKTRSGKDAKEWETGSSKEALCIIYVDGVYQGLKVIPSSTTFLQGNSKVNAPFIRFGSEDCDLDVYNIRVYDQALTPAQIVNNYSYDTPKYEDKLAIAKRNDIFDSTSLGNKPNINIEKLRKARPDLPFWYVKINTDEHEEVLPVDKDNWINFSMTEWKNPMNQDQPYEGAISFTTTGGQMKNQGTSSMSYPWPWRNWDWKLKRNKFVLGNGEEASKWCQYKGMHDTEDLKKITLKKDYASSEMCNNAITSEYFTDMALAIGDDFPDVLSPAQRELGSKTPFRLTFKAIPCFMFHEFADATQQGTAGKGYDALGMMNLIPNKNECGHLGFMGAHTWEENRSQSWELADNMDDWFWYKKLNGIQRNSDGTFTNDLKKCYEARYPKDSTLNEVLWNDKKDEADFGMTPDYDTITNDQYAAVRQEQTDIVAFHNWLVDCNRQIPEDYYNGLCDEDGNLLPVEQQVFRGKYRELGGDEMTKDWNKNEDGSYNKFDTPAYRLNKFINEAPTRMIIDQFCLYYVWRETFHAFDSGFKNLQVYTMGKANPDVAYMQWGCMVRDADTTLGIENTGKNIFPPHLEDIDYYTATEDEEGNAVSNVEFVYGGAAGLYHNKSISAKGGHAVLNGQLGSLWINLRDGFSSKIGDIYRALVTASKNSNWTSGLAIKRFRDHQEKWCESLYNFGMRQYFGGSHFTKWIESGLGDKKNSRASWLERGFYYRNSKYKNLNDYCALRAVCYYTPDLDNGHTELEPLQIKTYIPMYFGVGAHEQLMSSCSKFIRVTDVENTFPVAPGSTGFDFGHEEGDDTVSWFFGTDQVTELGDLARCCKVKTFQYLNFPKLRELNLGHEKDRDNKVYMETYSETDEHGVTTKHTREYTNQYLDAIDCSSLKQMTLLDITNHTNIKTLDLTACDQLQKLYARGTKALRTIELPATTALDTIYFGTNLTGLNLENLTSIKKFVLEGADKFERLYIQNCGDYMAAQSYDIMKQAMPALEKVFDPDTNNNICILTNVNWQNADSAYLEKLLNINATLSGKIVVKALSNDLKIRLINKYGNIDDPNHTLYIKYNQTEITSAKMPSKLYIHEAGQHQLSFTVTPPAANTYKSAIWKLDANAFATIDEAKGIVTRNDSVADENVSAKLTVTIKQLPFSDGEERPDIVLESTMYFYERIAKPGDIVFNDGTYSDELDDSKTPIGVCFYVDPTDNTKRLMVALESITLSSNVIEWGLGDGGNNTSGSQITGYYGSPTGINLGEGVTYNCYDLANLINYSISGPAEVPDAIYYDDATYRDAGADKNGFFKNYSKASYYGDLGWKDAENVVKVDQLKNEDGTTKSITINTNDRVPSGYYNTLAIIQHRNKVLDAYADRENNLFVRPYTTNDYDELTMLNRLMTRADQADVEGRLASIGKTYGSHLYYPAASACFAYEPTASNLNDKFKKYNWFLPASGDLVRILYYAYQSYKDGKAVDEPVDSIYGSAYSEPANAFANAIKLGKLNMNYLYGGHKNASYQMSSSTEGASGTNYITINSATGKWNPTSKGNGSYVRPICQF